jgi:PKD repeat protein
VLLEACTVQKQSTPPLSGPSEFGTSLTLSASPEVLPQDGASQSVVTVVALDAASKPISGLGIHWDATSAERLLPIPLNATSSVTDANGRATVVVTAPQQPAQQPITPDTITVSATPLSGNASNEFPRIVTIRLQPPSGTPPATSTLQARFVVAPTPQHAGADLRFDASASTAPLNTVITRYSWDFGDGVVEITTTPTTSHVYTESRVYPVTLTVTDDAGDTSTTGQTLTVAP